jgi:hypothetical protein
VNSGLYLFSSAGGHTVTADEPKMYRIDRIYDNLFPGVFRVYLESKIYEECV